MVAKISTGKDLYGALAYNQTKVEEGHAKILDANLLPYPEDGRFRMGETMEAFTAWLPSHYRTEKPVIHISLNKRWRLSRHGFPRTTAPRSRSSTSRSIRIPTMY